MVEKIQSSVSGITFCNVSDEMWKRICGKEVILRREPTNKWDKNAIEVLFENYRLGYVERDVAKELALQMDQGAKTTAVVVGTNGTPKDRPVLAIAIEVIKK
jgi:hypothetical protein